VAVFGNLEHISLSDLLPMLASQEGALEIFNVPGHPNTTLYVRQGTLCCLHVAGKPVEALQVRSVIGKLMQARRGGFEFLPGAKPRGQSKVVGIPIQSLLVSAATFNDELSEVRDLLPHPDTMFRLVRLEPVDERRMADFLDHARALLITGASARELAARVHVSLDDARLYLHKLRQMGMALPVRTRTEALPPVRKGLAQRLLGALRERFGRRS
jgi:hypothetical protein